MRQLKGYYEFDKREEGSHRGILFSYDTDLVNSDGANYHLWVPRTWSEQVIIEFKDQFKSFARNLGDPVSFTWDWMPPTCVICGKEKKDGGYGFLAKTCGPECSDVYDKEEGLPVGCLPEDLEDEIDNVRLMAGDKEYGK